MTRILNILEYALRSLLRRKIKNTVLLIIYSAVIAFFTSIIFLTGSLEYESNILLGEQPELTIQKLTGGRLQPISISIADSIRKIRGVYQIVPRVWGYYYDSPTGAVFTVIGSDSTLPGLNLIDTKGTALLTDSTAYCGSGFAELHHLQINDQLTILDANGKLKGFTLTAIFDSELDLLSRDLVVLSENSARTILGLRQSEATDIAVSIHNEDEVDNIGFKISRQFYGLRVVSREQLAITYSALFGWRGGIFMYGGLIALFAFLILAWDRASGLSKEERQELGILKALGWQISDVLVLKVCESGAVSITATLFGIVIGYAHVFIFNALLIKPFLIGWSRLYPDYNLTPVIDPTQILMIIFISVIPYLSATLFPAWRGAITDPAEVMQNG